MGARTVVGRHINKAWNGDFMREDGQWQSHVDREAERQKVIQRNRELAPPDLTDATIHATREAELRRLQGRTRRSTMTSLLGGM